MEVEDSGTGTAGILTNGHSPVNFASNSNGDFENANPSVRLKFSAGKGQIVTCVESQLTKGTVVFQENPYVSVLLPQFISSNCSHCHKRLEHLHFFPCSSCTQIKYCSPPCAASAFNSYHKWECGSIDFLHSVGIAHLAIRVVLVAGYRRILRQDSLGACVGKSSQAESTSLVKDQPFSGLILSSALEAYSLSLLFAPVSSAAFDSALANRSAVYSEMSNELDLDPQVSSDDANFKQIRQFALEDAKVAVSSPNYPKSLAAKLTTRIAGILIKLKIPRSS